MFTFSFGSAFAAAPTADKYTTDRSAAMKEITDAAQTLIDQVDVEATALLRTNTLSSKTDFEKKAYADIVAEQLDVAKSAIYTAQTQAINAFTNAEKIVEDTNNKDILGYIVKDDSSSSTSASYVVESQYVDVFDIVKDKLGSGVFGATYFTTQVGAYLPGTGTAGDKLLAEYTLKYAKQDTIAAVNALDLTVYSTEAKNTTSSLTIGTATVPVTTDMTAYEAAVLAKTYAVNELGKLSYTAGAHDAAAEAAKATNIYRVDNKGTESEAMAGSLGTFLKGLKKTTVALTDAKKIEYAKNNALATVTTIINSQLNKEVAEQNQIIFAQEISAKPNQDKIDEANEKIEAAKAKYADVLEVWTYRINNAEYRIRTTSVDYIEVYYNDVLDNDLITLPATGYLGYYTDGVFTAGAPFTSTSTYSNLEAIIPATTAQSIVKDVKALKEQAEALKNAVAVDGDVAIDIDKALEEAIDEEYMTGSNSGLNTVTVETAVHAYIHDLLDNTDNEVTIDKKDYPTVAKWTASATLAGYDAAKKDEIKALAKATVKSLKAAKTVAEADEIFLKAYAEFDAIPTTVEHVAMFSYGGELYEAYAKARAEIRSYVTYKVEVMGTDFAGTAENLRDYFATDDAVGGVLFTKVYSAADLSAKLTEAKATVDALKTKAELKDEKAALDKAILAVKVPVTLDAKDEIVKLYRDVVDYNDYCDMLGYTSAKIATNGLLKGYVDDVAALEVKAMKKLVTAIEKDGEITLADRENVEALVAANKAYVALYVDDLAELETSSPLATATKTEPTFTAGHKASYYENEIFKLDVKAAAKLIRELPVNADAAKVAEARAAVEALGFDGICEMLNLVDGSQLLTKLNKFEQDVEENVKALIADVTVKASSAKVSKGIKVTVKADVSALEEAGYTVEYKFYRSTKKASGYVYKMTSKTGKYTNTAGKKGVKYYYKAKLVVKNAAGEVVAESPLKQCTYACRTWTK